MAFGAGAAWRAAHRAPLCYRISACARVFTLTPAHIACHLISLFIAYSAPIAFSPPPLSDNTC